MKIFYQILEGCIVGCHMKGLDYDFLKMILVWIPVVTQGKGDKKEDPVNKGNF